MLPLIVVCPAMWLCGLDTCLKTVTPGCEKCGGPLESSNAVGGIDMGLEIHTVEAGVVVEKT